MKTEHETRGAIVYVRLTSSVREAIDIIAKEERRTLSTQIAVLIDQALEARKQRTNGETK